MTRRRRSSPSLTSVLIVLVLLAGLWALNPKFREVLGNPDGKPTVTTARAKPRVNSGADDLKSNVQAAKSLGGSIDYGRVDAATGQRSGISATITPAMVKAADEDRIGSPANSTIHPPGFDALPSRNRSRGHLLGRQLGGSGDVEANLVALYQQRANSPVMRDYESDVAKAVEAGETVRYQVLPLYRSKTDTGAPYAVRLKTSGNHGFKLDVQIANTPQGTVKVLVAP
jgi:DNA/RNA non-specific endonuclease